MGKLALAAKITHVPSMYLSELPGQHQGCREAAIEGHRTIARRARDLDVDTVVVFDVHWLVNSGYHINCHERFTGTFTSKELPHFIQGMSYEYRGDPELGRLIAKHANDTGVKTRAHELDTLELEYGTLVPMRYMNQNKDFRVVSCAAWCAWHTFEESRKFGEAVRSAIEASDSTVMVLASGSLSHRFQDNANAEKGMFEMSREFDLQVDRKVVELWERGDFRAFAKMLPEYAEYCHGEGHMHDTAMLLGVLGWDTYERGVEVVTPYFASSGTGQINAIFPVS